MERVISLIGILVFFGVAYFFSIDRRAINWRTVAWGFAIQFLFGLFVLKVPSRFSQLRRSDREGLSCWA
jgi:CNT family concentrative nucleoside transporter